MPLWIGLVRAFSIAIIIAFWAPAESAHSEIKTYFNYSTTGETYLDPYRGFERPGHNMEQVYIDQIRAAESSIDLAVFEFRLPLVAQELVKKAKSGVVVRVIIDNQNNKPFRHSSAECEAMESYYSRPKCLDMLAFMDLNGNGIVDQKESSERDAIVILSEGGVPVIDDTNDLSRGSGLMHHKFLIVDGHRLVLASENLTWSGIHGDFTRPMSRGNTNGFMVFESKPLSELFAEEFAIMWGTGQPSLASRFGLRKPYRPVRSVVVDGVRIDVKYSPTSSQRPYDDSTNGWLASQLRSALHRIDVANFAFSEQQLTDAIATAYNRNKNMELFVLSDLGFAYRYYSELLDFWGLTLLRNQQEAPRNFCTPEDNNHPWVESIPHVDGRYLEGSSRQGAGSPVLGPGDRMHHKFAIIDADRVIFGSHNWSEVANRQNDEYVVTIHDASITDKFSGEFERLLKSSYLGPPSSLKNRIEDMERQCRVGG